MFHQKNLTNDYNQNRKHSLSSVTSTRLEYDVECIMIIKMVPERVFVIFAVCEDVCKPDGSYVKVPDGSVRSHHDRRHLTGK